MISADPELVALKRKIRADRGFNCNLYKDKCLLRRLGVRMRARGVERFADYAALLDADAAEYDRLIDTLTVNVTRFFRNREAWEAIARDVVPIVMEGDSAVDVWSAGCSSGEEPYSLAILFHEWARASGREVDLERVRIRAVDIDRSSLRAAARAEYPELSLEETPPDLRLRWFSSGPPYRIADELRDRVTFEAGDLLEIEPARDLSLILCRNVIIYFDRAAQERLFEIFHDALAPGGFLVLGRAETPLGAARAMFRPVNARERIYRKPG